MRGVYPAWPVASPSIHITLLDVICQFVAPDEAAVRPAHSNYISLMNLISANTKTTPKHKMIIFTIMFT